MMPNMQASFFNHSCEPNCNFYVDSLGCLTVVAIRDVLAGEQLCIPYISVARRRDTVQRRRAMLQDKCYFHCGCARCTREHTA